MRSSSRCLASKAVELDDPGKLCFTPPVDGYTCNLLVRLRGPVRRLLYPRPLLLGRALVLEARVGHPFL